MARTFEISGTTASELVEKGTIKFKNPTASEQNLNLKKHSSFPSKRYSLHAAGVSFIVSSLGTSAIDTDSENFSRPQFKPELCFVWSLQLMLAELLRARTDIVHFLISF